MHPISVYMYYKSYELSHENKNIYVFKPCYVFSFRIQPARSSPVAMPGGRQGQRHLSGDSTPSSAGGAALLIEAGRWNFMTSPQPPPP